MLMRSWRRRQAFRLCQFAKRCSPKAYRWQGGVPLLRSLRSWMRHCVEVLDARCDHPEARWTKKNFTSSHWRCRASRPPRPEDRASLAASSTSTLVTNAPMKSLAKVVVLGAGCDGVHPHSAQLKDARPSRHGLAQQFRSRLAIT